MSLPRKSLIVLISLCIYIGGITLLAENPSPASIEPTLAEVDDLGEKAAKVIDKDLSDDIGRYVKWSVIMQNIIYLYFAATLVEAGLGVIFRWRVWVRYFDAKGIKVPIIIAYSALLLKCTHTDPVYNIFKDGLKLEKMDDPDMLCTGILSALLIAGGSAGIIALYKKLKLRDGGEATENKKNKERSKRRFKIISVVRKQADPNYPIQVVLDKKIIGTIASGKNSFAAFAGFEIDGEKAHTLELKGHDKEGKPIDSPVISDFEIAEGAIVEFAGSL